MAALSDRPLYTREQLSKYVSFINPDTSYSLEALEAEIKQDPLEALSNLLVRQLAAAPWGNVSLHYSWHRSLSLHPQVLFHKIVERRLGGYCMEINTFFSTVLASLGYSQYVTGARICTALMGNRASQAYSGWQHQVIIVTIDGQKYAVDAGFGSGCPTRPVPLDVDSEKDYEAVPGAFIRLRYKHIAPNTTDQKLWVLELKNTTTNWLPEDFELINYRTAKDLKSWFTHRLALVKTIVDAETGCIPIGRIALWDKEIERRVNGGDKEILLQAKTEDQRVQGLRQWFGIELLPEETSAIRALPSEIRDGPGKF